MNATEAVNKIVQLLGLKFQNQKFFDTMLKDGETKVTNNEEGDFMVGQSLYIVGESTLSPAPAGDHITREGLILVVDAESKITEIKEEKVEESEVVEDVVEDIKEDESQEEFAEFPWDECILEMENRYGSKEIAERVCGSIKAGNFMEMPKELVMNVSVPSAYEKESVEQFSKVKESLGILVDVIKSMETNFSSDIKNLKSEFNDFKKSPERKAVVKTETPKETFQDFRASLLMGLKNNKNK